MAWDWQIFCKETTTGEQIAGCFGKGGDQTYLNWIFSAWGWTLTVAAGAAIVSFIIGLLMGALRTLPNAPWWVRLGNAWTELFRNIPLLVQIFVWYIVLPAIFPVLQKIPSAVLVVMALGFFTSARVSEQIKSGIQALPKGQRYAAMAVGMSTWQTYRFVLLPMALRIVIPPLTSESMNVIKNSSVAFAASVAELIFFARQAGEETSAPLVMYTAVTVLYMISSLTVNRAMVLLERKARVPGFIAGAGAGGGH